MSGPYRVWLCDEFMDYDENERHDHAWRVPNAKSFMNPDSKGVPCDDVDDAATQYADYFHSQRDGWESAWPLEFVVHDGTDYYRVSVSREMVPEFYCDKPRKMVVGDVVHP